ncbi:helix-turn-helix domain-containing protein [Phenylobacterium sp. VNQ135]|uniref:helix-turn-helix domain-containing protein n=1 Tax=Phenylobacterium sp. VNQ135 TaxID=3400922 RepID=UPI003C1250CF
MPKAPKASHSVVALELGRRLRLQRLAAKLSQADLASRLGCSQQMIGKYEAGQAIPPADRLLNFLRLTGDTRPASIPPDFGGPLAEMFFATPGGRTLAAAFVRISPQQRRALVAVAQEIARTGGSQTD